MEKKLGPKGMPPGLVANIPEGMRAYAVDVTEQSGVSGFVLPGHRVDVVRYDSEKGVQQAETILQDILVLASGQVFTRAEERTLSTRTVTLAVKPDQVTILVAARSKGPLALASRGVNDHDVVVESKAKHPDMDALEKRWKLEEDRRKQVEKELAAMKDGAGAALHAAPASHTGRAAFHHGLSRDQPGASLPNRPGSGGGAGFARSPSSIWRPPIVNRLSVPLRWQRPWPAIWINPDAAVAVSGRLRILGRDEA